MRKVPPSQMWDADYLERRALVVPWMWGSPDVVLQIDTRLT